MPRLSSCFLYCPRNRFYERSIFAEAGAGATAILFAGAHPGRVDSLILGNAQARFSWAPNYPIGLKEADVEEILRMVDLGWGKAEGLGMVFPTLAADESVMHSLVRSQPSLSPTAGLAGYRGRNPITVREPSMAAVMSVLPKDPGFRPLPLEQTAPSASRWC